MKIRAIDPATGDWLFGKGSADYLTGNAAIGQAIKCEIQSVLGDCFFALNDGIYWFNLLGSKNLNQLQIAISARILQIDGVVSLNSITISLDAKRNAFINYSVNTVYTQNNPNAVLAATDVFLLTESGDYLVTEGGGAIEGG